MVGLVRKNVGATRRLLNFLWPRCAVGRFAGCLVSGFRPPPSPCRLLRVVYRFVEQLLQGRVDRFLSRAADPFVTDGSLAIEDIVRWRAGIPSSGDRLTRDGSPGDFLLLHDLFELLR